MKRTVLAIRLGVRFNRIAWLTPTVGRDKTVFRDF